ncbi:Gldg family protein [Marinifilum sp.]|uniref:Gldg family protein n=1 Tax=Marinifilum sp. TaxID=2033137 RepID=UPI003BAD9A85
MKNIFTIARMELQKMFFSPIAWLVLIIFGIQCGFEIISDLNNQVRMFELGYARPAVTASMFAGMNGFFVRIPQWLFIYIPLVTMALMSKEYSSGSIKLLYSSPISNIQIVLGKYLAALVFVACMSVLLLLAGVLGLFTIENVDFPHILTAVLGLFLMMATYAAVGLFISSLTSYQIVAAIGTFLTLFVFQKIGDLWQTVEMVRNITYWLSISGRSSTFVRGLICSEDVLYFILVSGLFISYTIFRLKSIREKSHRLVSTGRYLSAFLLVAIIGFVSTIPSLMKYYDATATKTNTLTVSSQEVVSKLDGKVKITAYANVFGDNFYGLSPRSQVRDADNTWGQYSRFFPNLELEYKYYYALPTNEQALKSHNRRYADMTLEQALEKVCNTWDMNPKKVKPAEFYKDEINLEAEMNRCVRKIETADGKFTYVHFFNDMYRVPFESQKTAALKGLVQTLPMIGFVDGHQERNVNNISERGFYTVAKEKTFRHALRNNGIDFVTVNLNQPVEPFIDALVIAEAKTQYTETEMKNLNDFVDRGGNLVIAADRKRQEAMNPLVERFGVTFEPGQVVEYNKGYTMDLVTSVFTEEGMKLSYPFEETIVAREQCVTMPGALALSYEDKGEFAYTTVLRADSIGNLPKASDMDEIKKNIANQAIKFEGMSAEDKRLMMMLRGREDKSKDSGKYKGSWNELVTTDFVDEVPLYNPEEGEIGGPVTTALALTRKVGDKEQRIMILGDADCISNGEISRQRANIQAGNFNFVGGLFFWLTNNESPVDMRRPTPPDNALKIVKDDAGPYKMLYRFVFPALLLLIFLLIWLRRRGR